MLSLHLCRKREIKSNTHQHSFFTTNTGGRHRLHHARQPITKKGAATFQAWDKQATWPIQWIQCFVYGAQAMKQTFSATRRAQPFVGLTAIIMSRALLQSAGNQGRRRRGGQWCPVPPFHVWPPGCYIYPILCFKNVALRSVFWLLLVLWPPAAKSWRRACWQLR